MLDDINVFWRDESGATAIEYCLIASVIAMAIVAGLTRVGSSLQRFFLQIAAVN